MLSFVSTKTGFSSFVLGTVPAVVPLAKAAKLTSALVVTVV